eukprot:5927489-Prymnesium_polylepis.1
MVTRTCSVQSALQRWLSDRVLGPRAPRRPRIYPARYSDAKAPQHVHEVDGAQSRNTRAHTRETPGP